MAIIENFSSIPKERWDKIFGAEKQHGGGTFVVRDGKVVKVSENRETVDLDLGEIPVHTDPSGGFYDASIDRHFKSRRDRKDYMKANDMIFVGNFEKAPLKPYGKNG